MGDGSCRRDILDLGRDGILTQRPLGGGQKVLSVRVFRVENKEVQRALANGSPVATVGCVVYLVKNAVDSPLETVTGHNERMSTGICTW